MNELQSMKQGLENASIPARSAFRGWTTALLLFLTDFCVLYLTQIAVVGLENASKPFNFSGVVQVTAISLQITVLLMALAWFHVLGHYNRRQPFWDEIRDVLIVIPSVAALDLFLTVLLGFEFALLAEMTHWFVGGFTLIVTRQAIKHLLRRTGFWERPAILIADSEVVENVITTIESDINLGYSIRRILTVDNSDKQQCFGKNRLIPEKIAEHLGEITTQRLPHVFVAWGHSNSDLMQELIEEVAIACNRMTIIPPLHGMPLLGADVQHVFSREALLIGLRNNLNRKGARLIKRLFDITVSLFLLTILSPALALIAVIIKSDGGNIFFGHERIGQNGKRFKCLKFRSMVQNADKVLENLLRDNLSAREEWQRDFKLKNDPRITRLGAFLRKSSMDELPQLINVLKGEMSLVGPRPIIEEEIKRYDSKFYYYLEAKPGVTGLWQVSGRNDTEYDERINFDVWYVRNWSLWYDIVILFKTVKVVLVRSGAY